MKFLNPNCDIIIMLVPFPFSIFSGEKKIAAGQNLSTLVVIKPDLRV
jgi:hypothetical protein